MRPSTTRLVLLGLMCAQWPRTFTIDSPAAVDILHPTGNRLEKFCVKLLSRYERKLEEGRVCNSVFNSTRGFKERADDLPRAEMLEKVGRDNRGHPLFMGGHQQDWWVWINHARYLNRTGVFLDLATNHPIIRSNTFILEACMGWRGICIEPVPTLQPRIIQERTCRLFPNCISTKEEHVPFFVAEGNTAGSSHIASLSGHASQGNFKGKTVPVECKTLSSVVEEAGVTHIDMLSLDIEGHEAEALKTLDLNKITVDIIIAEKGGDLAKAYPALIKKHQYVNHGKKFNLGGDYIFLRKGFKLGIEQHGGSIIPNPRIRNRPRQYHECGFYPHKIPPAIIT